MAASLRGPTWWVCICALTLVAPARARAERLPIRTYTTADGLPHDRITQIVRDSRGFLWFCTPGGLSRFDGARFVVYPRTPETPHHTINAILEDVDGTYWIATNGGGVYHFDPQPDTTARRRPRFVAIVVGAEPATMRVNALFRDRAGQLWAGTDAGLFELDRPSTRFQPIRLEPAERRGPAPQVWSFLEDADRTLWIGTSDGLRLKTRDGPITRHPVRPENGLDHVWSLLLHAEQIWIGHPAGLAAITPARAPTVGVGEIRWYGPADGVTRVPGNRVALFQTDDRHLWAGQGGDLIEFDGTRFRVYGRPEGLNASPISALVDDLEGNLWAGTLRGAMRIARHGLTTFAQDDGLATARVGRIFETRTGELCAITAGPFINIFDGRRFHAIRPNLRQTEDDTDVAVEARSGEWWIPVRDRLIRFPSVARVEDLARIAPRAIYTASDGIPEGDIRQLFEDSRGDIWIAARTRSANTLSRWDRATDRFQRYAERDGLPPFGTVESFAEDHAGNVWLGLWDGGAARYRDGRFFVLSDESSAEWGGSRVYVDRTGKLWASMRAGLRRIDDPAANLPQLAEASLPLLADAQPLPFGEDGAGALYFRITQGIARFDPASGDVTRYTTADGLAQLEPTFAFRARDGAIWFATGQGVSRLRPQPARRTDPPVVLIGGARVAGEPYPLSDLGQSDVGGVELPADRRQIEFDFFAISFRAGDLVRYQYLLEGADRNWSPPSDQRSVTYARLAPGSYRFLVRAVNGSGRSTRPATFAFSVLAPVWQRGWFLSLIGLASAAIVYAGFKYRLRRLLEVERIRTRIATDLHDDIGASLSQIAVVSEVVRRRTGPSAPDVVEPLAQIATMARELVDGMSDIVWAIDPQKDRMASLAARMRRLGADVLSAKEIAFTFMVHGEENERRIGADTRRELLLVFKEAINNIIRHARATDVRVDLRLEHATISLVVADNGTGFDPTVASDGNGLASMRTRARRLGGILDLQSASGGTTLTLRCPVGLPTYQIM